MSQRIEKMKELICSDRFTTSLSMGIIGSVITFFLTGSIGWAIVGVFVPAGLYGYFITTER